MKYQKGYRFQLPEDFRTQVLIYPATAVVTDWVKLDTRGWLHLKKGYAWNGANGPAFNTPNSIRASATHDALYQLIQMGLLADKFRKQADEEMYFLLVDAGMGKLRAKIWYRAVRLAGGPSIEPANANPVLLAP